MLTEDVDAPADRVFAELTDLERLERWRTVESIRLEPAGPAQVGTRLHTSVNGLGQMHFVNEITELDPAARAYNDRSLEGTFVIESGWQVEPVGTGSRIRWTTRYQGRGPFKLLGPILGVIIKRGQQADLQRFVKLVVAD